MAALSGLLLALPFLHTSLFAFCWLAFVPLLLAIRHATARESYLLGLVAGLAFQICATYWIVDFVATLKGYNATLSFAVALLFWFYCAQVTGLVALLFTWIKRLALAHEIILFPVLFVALYNLFPVPFTVRPGESQSQFLIAIQAIEFTGVYGLDFVIAMTNVTVYLWFDRDAHRNRLVVTLVVAAVLVAWLGYGVHATSIWSKRLATWSSVPVGIVQPNEIPSIDTPPSKLGYSRAYPLEMELTEQLVAAGAELIIWPETRFKGYLAHDHVRRAFQHRLAAMATPLVFQDTDRVYLDGHKTEYNTAVFIDSNGQLAGTYRKIQRIAFGEYIPLLEDIPAIRSWAGQYFGDFFSEVSPGNGPAVFNANPMKIAPLICYEVMFPIFTARALEGSPKGKVLVTLSNDGWFGDTRQHYQHLHASSLRAVENRVPLIHVLNNGPSSVIAPDGRFVFKAELGVAGGYLADVPYSPSAGGSLFSRHPQWFIFTVYWGLALIALFALTRYTTTRLKQS
ncbi:MAG: apolipoprotein N-acyltransferase [Candidatus Obscuribacterales bacterium]|nr:apolipoprotein N-acyltransferase [Steroidobacteraceae bacterium]